MNKNKQRQIKINKNKHKCKQNKEKKKKGKQKIIKIKSEYTKQKTKNPARKMTSAMRFSSPGAKKLQRIRHSPRERSQRTNTLTHKLR